MWPRLESFLLRQGNAIDSRMFSRGVEQVSISDGIIPLCAVGSRVR
jgi:hypothetical protein